MKPVSTHAALIHQMILASGDEEPLVSRRRTGGDLVWNDAVVIEQRRQRQEESELEH